MVHALIGDVFSGMLTTKRVAGVLGFVIAPRTQPGIAHAVMKPVLAAIDVGSVLDLLRTVRVLPAALFCHQMSSQLGIAFEPSGQGTRQSDGAASELRAVGAGYERLLGLDELRTSTLENDRGRVKHFVVYILLYTAVALLVVSFYPAAAADTSAAGRSKSLIKSAPAPGARRVYFLVMLIEVCPSHSFTLIRGAPRITRCDANVCRIKCG